MGMAPQEPAAPEPAAAQDVDVIIAPAPPQKVKRDGCDVTLDRQIEWGRTPDCKGCRNNAGPGGHDPRCVERFRKLVDDERAAKALRPLRPRGRPRTRPETPRAAASEPA